MAKIQSRSGTRAPVGKQASVSVKVGRDGGDSWQSL